MKKGVLYIGSFFIMFFSGVLPSVADISGDINADGRIGLEEAISALSVTAGLRAVSSDITYDIADYRNLSNQDYVYAEKKFEAGSVSETVFTAAVSDQTINGRNLRVTTYGGGAFAGMQEYAVFDGENLTIVGWNIPAIPRTYWYTPGYLRGKSGMKIGDVLSSSYVLEWGTAKSLAYREDLILGTEDVTVPAGFFADCLKIRTYRDNDDVYISYLAKNVGLVKQISVSPSNPNGSSYIWELKLQGVSGEIFENTSQTCSDGIDNDGDSYIDCDDFDCKELGSCP
jgi:hypothetical protein